MKPAVDKSAPRIASMFDAIAGRYDLLNYLLSVGLDRRWRARAVDELRLGTDDCLLDLCTGTADLAIEAAIRRPPPMRIIGVDFAWEMLRRARGKVHDRRLDAAISLTRGDAAMLPLRDGSVDAASIGFGIRNVERPERACAELARVLRPGGRLAILEFGFPRIPGIRTLYGLYFRFLLPLIGRTVSRHADAYSYLPASVEAFRSPESFCALLESSGFVHARAVPLTMGIVYLFMAERARE
ncbi:MAG TPA: bifunctional demethylmenaquinone methyltransferase/2-methoxy-6-polyprenyl-1,4-benzoquinol methylase UbiE [Vicinamibacterales bacterium]|nr:bifunctional demethylmenaquinone methyltransferase/2-methoxy-6-polyprenyl-1,4-benzoquinol methylase UbiE [Vicinamibacterales bacterium]